MNTARTFDWSPRYDPRSRNYTVSRLLAEPVPRVKRRWSPGPVLDQGNEGACVGFGWSGELAASPARVPDINDGYAAELYHEAQLVDEWAGSDYEGTSVLGGAIAVKNRGLIGSYSWAFDVDETIDALIALGPVVIGIPWFDSMYETRPSGLVEVGGRQVGGHCLLLTGYHPGMRISGEGWFTRHEVVRWRNSWGSSYGLAGDGLVKVADLALLLSGDSESCIPAERSLPESLT